MINGMDFSKMTEAEALRAIGFRAAERDGEIGLEKDGSFFPSLKEGECPEFIVASSARWSWVKGCIVGKCTKCGAEVGIAPNTQEVMANCPKSPVICLLCMQAMCYSATSTMEGIDEEN